MVLVTVGTEPTSMDTSSGDGMGLTSDLRITRQDPTVPEQAPERAKPFDPLGDLRILQKMTPAERESALRSRSHQRGSSNPRGASASDAQQLRGYGRRIDDLESKRAAMDVKVAELSDTINLRDVQCASMQMLATSLACWRQTFRSQ